MEVIRRPSTETTKQDCSGKFLTFSEIELTSPPIRISVERIAGKRRALSNDAFGETVIAAERLLETELPMSLTNL
jgi:hypothetical protein